MSIDRRLISLTLILARWLAAKTQIRPAKSAKPPELVKQQGRSGFRTAPVGIWAKLGPDPSASALPHPRRKYDVPPKGWVGSAETFTAN
jgi:hypothetical protein